MTTMRLAPLALALLLAGGCDGGTPAEPTKVRSIAVQNPLHDQLQGLSELNRGLALRRAIQDSGSTCKKVEEMGFVADYKALKMWNARCSGPPQDYALFIAANGDVQVRTCADVKTLGMPACTLPPAE